MSSTVDENPVEEVAVVPSQTLPLTQFTLFSKLPRELRYEIWKFTIEPRVVEPSYCKVSGFLSTFHMPEASQACLEAEDVIGKCYTWCFGCLWFPDQDMCFNFAMDTLYLCGTFRKSIPWFFSVMPETLLAKIKYLAIDMALFWDPRAMNGRHDNDLLDVLLRGLYEVVGRMKCLEEVQEVYEIQHWADHIVWKHPRFGAMNVKLFDELSPVCLAPGADIDPNLPRKSPFFRGWPIPKVSTVFGVRDDFQISKIASRGPRTLDDGREHFGWLAEEYTDHDYAYDPRWDDE